VIENSIRRLVRRRWSSTENIRSATHRRTDLLSG